MEDILHIREAVNYFYLLSNQEKVSEADALAWMVSILLFSPEIKDAVKDTTNKNVLLAALTEISIEYSKAGND